VRLLALASLPCAINITYFSVKRVRHQLKGLLVLSALNAGIILGLSYLLLPRVGILGVGYAFIAAQLVIAAIAMSESPRVRNLFSFLRR
jgi:O-antigen/teichoic acid export membrane protein